jgi:hypothetical protein
MLWMSPLASAVRQKGRFRGAGKTMCLRVGPSGGERTHACQHNDTKAGSHQPTVSTVTSTRSHHLTHSYLVAKTVPQGVGVESGGGAGKSQLLPPWPRARQRPALGGGGADLEVEAGAVAGGGGERTQTPRDVVHVVESQELRVQSVV